MAMADWQLLAALASFQSAVMRFLTRTAFENKNYFGLKIGKKPSSDGVQIKELRGNFTFYC